MKLTEFFLAELDREVERSRRALEQVPEGKYDWKPHDKSMIFGYLADMVAMIPSWITMEITQNELDVAPADGGQIKQTRKETSDALVKALDKAAADARAAFAKTTDEHFDDAVAAAGPRSGGDGVAALRDDPGHDQPLGASPRTDDGLCAAAGREGSGPLRPVRGRQAVPIDLPS